MPEPSWTFFAIALALIVIIEWEEVAGGHVPRSRLGRIAFGLPPLAYTALVLWIFVLAPLAYAGRIRTAAAPVCTGHRGLDETGVSIEHAGYHHRSGRPYNTPHNDQITVRCIDGTSGSGEDTPRGISFRPS